MSVAPVPILEAPSRSAFSDGGRFYRPELDVLRFGAFLLVFLSHAMPSVEGSSLLASVTRSIRGGCAFGVSLFFLLSAYLITELLLREKESRGSIKIRAFYIRRSLRIWPIYFFMLLTTFLIGLKVHTFHVTPGALAAYSLLVGNWYTVLHTYLPRVAAPLWSIGIEEQFYVGWPALIQVGHSRLIAGASIALWIASQISVLYLGLHHANQSNVIWSNALVHAQYFAAGALLSVVMRGRVPTDKAPVRAVMIAAGLLCMFGGYLLLILSHADVMAKMFPVFFCFLLAGVGAVLIFIGTIGAKIPIAMRPLVILGKMSYGLYVYHSACLLLTERAFERFHLHASLAGSVLIALPLTMIVSYGSYHYFEMPFLRLKERFTIIESRGL